MSRIEKLQLQGIRSFGPHETDRQNVEFFSPLTLILGQNGCGKTTIIECLKYVTTGDPPPGSRSGASFVHDPKMARESTVRGQVKLLFTTVTGQQKIVSRSLEATQKVKNITMKTMDSTITTKQTTNQNQQISSKCADINAEMFMTLGVSKPILNYVIFCHQEDSNWPLEEGKKVKDKFDEIFNSAKYKNCLNNIKEIRKEEMENAKREGMQMSFFKSDKELCQEKKIELKRREKELRSTEEEVARLHSELEPLEKSIKEVMEEEKGFSHLHSKLTEANTKLECSRRERRDLEKQIVEVFDDSVSDSEINRRLRMFEQSESENQDKEVSFRERIDLFKQKEKNMELKIQKNAARLGQLISDQTKHQKDLDEKKKLVEKAEDIFAISIDPDTFTEAVRREEEKMINQIRRFKLEKSELEDQLNDSIDKLKSERATLEEKKKRGQSDLTEAKGQVARIKRELCELEGAGDQLQQLKVEWDSKQQELTKAKQSVDLEAIQGNIRTLRLEVQQLEKEEEKLKNELSALEEMQASVQQIEYLNSDIATKEEKRRKIVTKRNSVFLDLFQAIPDFKKIKAVFKAEQDRNEKMVKDMESEKQKDERSVLLKTESMMQIKKDRAKKMKRERELQSKVSDVLVGDEDLDSELAQTRDKLEALRKELQVKEAGKYTFKEFLDRMQRMGEPACPTCNRGFQDRSEAEELRRELEGMIQEIPRKVQGLEKKVKMEEKREQDLQSISLDYYNLKQIRTEIQEMSSQVTSIEKEIKELKEKKEAKEADWSKIADVSDQLRNIAEDVQLIDNLTRELNSLQERKDDLQMLTPSLEAGRGLETVRKEEKEVSTQLRRTRKECESQQEEYNTHSRLLNELESNCNKLTNRKLEIEGKQQQRANMLEKRADLEKKVGLIQKDLESANVDLNPLREDLEAKEAEKAQFLRGKEQELETLQAKERIIENLKMELKKVDSSILSYQNSNKGRELKDAIENKTEFDKDLAEIREEKGTVEEELKKIGLEKANQEGRKRNMKDNLQLRKLKEDEKCHSSEIEKYRTKLSNTDFAVVEDKKRRLARKMTDLNANINSKSGKIDEMKRSVKEIEMELQKPKLKNAGREYFKSVVKHRTLKMAVDDLDKYYRALDCAIMWFHKDKMRVVNRIIRELWRSTYRGNDIDYIEIKTDDGETGSGGADKRRSYNYRVVMVKNEVEMDMRGRCSAGQKVLAALIIRLALAETFAENCGIIALDEPTTNLDRENIESLAIELSNIATKQSSNRFFQLVVITHDEEFIELLSRCDKIQYYQKVFRNANGISEIRKMNVDTLDHENQSSEQL